MALLVISVLLTLAALVGIGLTFLSGSLFTVDGLFYTLILGAIGAMFAFNSFYELRRQFTRRLGSTGSDRTAAQDAAAAKTVAPASAPGTPQPTAGATASKMSPVSASVFPVRRAWVQAPRKSSTQPPSIIDGVTAGTLLIRTDVPIPDDLRTNSPRLYRSSGRDGAPSTWQRVEVSTAAALERPLHSAGLEIFYLVGAFQAGGWAFHRSNALAKALSPVLAHAEQRGRNAVEVTRLAARNWFGLYHVTVLAHIRHVQQAGYMLESPNAAAQARSPRVIAGAAGAAGDGMFPATRAA